MSKRYSSTKETVNPCGIQMLPRSIHRQIFVETAAKPITEDKLLKIEKHLTAHNLWGKKTPSLPDIDFRLPVLQGKNISEHFTRIAEKQCGNYRDKLLELTSNSIPDIPKHWEFTPGWTRYCEKGGTSLVDFPDEDAYVFDVEVCVKEGHFPTLATAVSNKYWYSWCSNQLFGEKVSFLIFYFYAQFSYFIICFYLGSRLHSKGYGLYL